MNNDKKATLVGAILFALTSVTIDFGKLISGDPEKMAPEVIKLLNAITMGVFGWLSNRPDKPKE